MFDSDILNNNRSFAIALAKEMNLELSCSYYVHYMTLLCLQYHMLKIYTGFTNSKVLGFIFYRYDKVKQ